ncbi:MAG: hypothetical protein ACP5D7_13840 [Limnospira sp.]
MGCSFEVAVYPLRGNDPHAGGVGAVFEAGTMAGFDEIVMPEGRVDFAGNHCPKFETRRIHGPIASGFNVALRVHQGRSVRRAGDLRHTDRHHAIATVL